MSILAEGIWKDNHPAATGIWDYVEDVFFSQAVSHRTAWWNAEGNKPQAEDEVTLSLNELWEDCREDLERLQSCGRYFPVCMFLDDSTPARVFVDHMEGAPLPPHLRYRLRYLCADRETARLGLEKAFQRGSLIEDDHGADPDGGFWVLVLHGGQLHIGLETLRAECRLLVREKTIALSQL
jgi:hypothetical protein